MSVISLLNQVKNGDIVLPNIQRNFVWSEEMICKLMDSIMRGYPIGIILMWETYLNIQFRKFTSSYIEEVNFDYSQNENESKKLLVLDGQQRLQSLFIALYGKYHKKQLYFELLSGQEKDNSAEIKYEFQFLTEKDAQDKNSASFEKFQNPENDDPSTDHEKWYYEKVNKLYEMGPKEILGLPSMLSEKINLDSNEQELVMKNIMEMKNSLQQNPHILKYSTLDENKSSKAKDRKNPADILEVFVRVNTEGTRLTKSDLIFSMLKLNWRDSAIDLPEFVDEINSNTNFDIDKDLIIKCLFAVCDFGPKYDVDILRTKSNADKIKENYNKCCDAIKSSIDFIRQHCWINSHRVIPGYNILIPFVYFLFHAPKHIFRESDISDIRKFFYISAFTRLFTRYSEFRIKIYIRDFLKPKFDKGNYEFSIDDSMKFLRRYETFDGINDVILGNNLHLTLNLLQKNLTQIDFDMKVLYQWNDPEVDHIFPKSTLRNKGWEDQKINHYANYWYLPKKANRNKSNKHPKVFLKDKKEGLGMTDTELKKYFIDTDLLNFNRYSTFLDKRSRKMRNFVSSTLEIQETDYIDEQE